GPPAGRRRLRARRPRALPARGRDPRPVDALRPRLGAPDLRPARGAGLAQRPRRPGDRQRGRRPAGGPVAGDPLPDGAAPRARLPAGPDRAHRVGRTADPDQRRRGAPRRARRGARERAGARDDPIPVLLPRSAAPGAARDRRRDPLGNGRDRRQRLPRVVRGGSDPGQLRRPGRHDRQRGRPAGRGGLHHSLGAPGGAAARRRRAAGDTATGV
ncbi:MAG: hypothetical protein AVDCRST_MAG49-510, partial [uncultured Thermomicrobiales bacterium]